MSNETITLTFGDVAENHNGMQALGTLASEGFDNVDLEAARNWFSCQGIETAIHLLNLDHVAPGTAPAQVLIARRGVAVWCDPDALLEELSALEWDHKALMRGRVVNKRARHNLIFGQCAQEPDYENGMGRVVPLADVPLLAGIHAALPLGETSKGLMVEGNRYYDETCGIGFHGDSERRKVIGVRLGATMPLDFQWHYQGERIGQRYSFSLAHGDLYVMSEKAVGYDWKRRKIPTLRHAAGADRFRV